MRMEKQNKAEKKIKIALNCFQGAAGFSSVRQKREHPKNVIYMHTQQQQ